MWCCSLVCLPARLLGVASGKQQRWWSQVTVSCAWRVVALLFRKAAQNLLLLCVCVLAAELWVVIAADKAEGDAESTGLPNSDCSNLPAFFPPCQTESHTRIHPALCAAPITLSITRCSSRIPAGCSPSLGSAVCSHLQSGLCCAALCFI